MTRRLLRTLWRTERYRGEGYHQWLIRTGRRSVAYQAQIRGARAALGMPPTSTRMEGPRARRLIASAMAIGALG